MAESVERVRRLLAGKTPLTGKEIREATGLPRRTVYGALVALRKEKVLRERPNLRDTRQTYFSLASPAQGPQAC